MAGRVARVARVHGDAARTCRAAEPVRHSPAIGIGPGARCVHLARAPALPHPEGRRVPLWWKKLSEQFGQEYASEKDFKKEFRKALAAALKVYPDARVDDVTGGIRLYPSPPPVKKTNVVVKLAAPDLVPPASVDRIVLNSETMLHVHEVAPGWDKYHLENVWREWIATKAGMPKDPDKAFLAWCKKYTKGKRPA